MLNSDLERLQNDVAERTLSSLCIAVLNGEGNDEGKMSGVK